MIQKNEVLTGEDNRISHISTKRITMQGDRPIIIERKTPVNTTEQTWMLEVREKTRVSGVTPEPVNTLVKIIKWLNHLGRAKVDDSCLESRQNIHHNITIKGIGL